MKPLRYPRSDFFGRQTAIIATVKGKRRRRTMSRLAPDVSWWSLPEATDRLSAVARLTAEHDRHLQDRLPLTLGIGFRKGSVATSIRGVGICCECLDRDLELGRVPFIRREWSNDWVSWCRRHNRVLMTRSIKEVARLYALAFRYPHLIPFSKFDSNVSRLESVGFGIDLMRSRTGSGIGDADDIDEVQENVENLLQMERVRKLQWAWDHETILTRSLGVSRRGISTLEADLSRAMRRPFHQFGAEFVELPRWVGEFENLGLLLRTQFPTRVARFPAFASDSANGFDLLAGLLYERARRSLPQARRKSRRRAFKQVSFDSHGVPLWKYHYGELSVGRMQWSFSDELSTRERFVRNVVVAGLRCGATARTQIAGGEKTITVQWLSVLLSAYAFGYFRSSRDWISSIIREATGHDVRKATRERLSFEILRWLGTAGGSPGRRMLGELGRYLPRKNFKGFRKEVLQRMKFDRESLTSGVPEIEEVHSASRRKRRGSTEAAMILSEAELERFHELSPIRRGHTIRHERAA